MTSQRQRLLGGRAPGARWRLLILTSGALLLGALLATVSLVYQSADMMLDQIQDDFNAQQLVLARQAAARVNAELGDIEVAIESLVHNLPGTPVEAKRLGLRAFFEWAHPKGALAAAVVSADGRIDVGLCDPETSLETLGLADCSGAVAGGALGRLALHELPSGRITVTGDLCHGLVADGRPDGVLRVRLDVTRLLSRVVGPIRSGQTGYAWVIDGAGRFLYHEDRDFVGRSAFEARHERRPYMSFRTIDRIMKDQMLLGQEGMGRYLSGWHRGAQGEIEKLIAFTPVSSAFLAPDEVWSVAVVAPVTEIADPVRRVSRRQFATQAALLLGIALLALLATAYQRWLSTGLAEQMGRQWEYMQSILKSSADAIAFVDNDNRVQVWNRGAELLFGYSSEEMVGHTFRRLVPPEIDAEAELQRIQQEAARAGFVRDYVATRVTKDGRRVTVDITRTPVRSEDGEVIGSTVIVRDVTAKMEWEQRIYHTEKLASIGNLAAGVAHEINNPLAVILGFTDLLLERAEPGTRDHEDLSVIAESGRSARLIVEKLLGFARITEGMEDTVDVGHCVKTVTDIVRNTLMTAKVELVNEVPEVLPRVCGDPREYQQVIFNLINNAVAAMEEGGTLTISATAARDAVRLSVADTGAGIPERIKARVFDPFFTTKKVGEGTGLGLSLCYGIVKKYGGSMSFVSSSRGDRPGEPSGTTFTVTMPVCERPGQRRTALEEQRAEGGLR